MTGADRTDPTARGPERTDSASWALLLSLCAVLGWAHRNYCVDDAFIFARVAENWVHGDGWGFNPGQPVNVNTSILWTWLLALLAPVGLTTLSIMAAFSLSAALAIAPLRRLTGSLGRWPSIALTAACLSCTTLWESTGLESALALALVAWTIVAATGRRPVLAGALLGLSILCRPDALVLGGLLVAEWWWAERRLPWRLVGTAALVLLPWLLYARMTFGSVVPVTLGAKTAQSAIGSWSMRPPFLIAALTYNDWWLLCLLLTLLWLGAWLPSWLRARAPAPAASLLVGYGLAQAAGYGVLRAPADYFWYYIPLHIALLVGAAHGFHTLLTWPRLRLTPPRRTQLVVTIATLATILFAWRGLHAGAYRLAPEYRALALRLRGLCGPDDQVASVEIGYVGHDSGCRVLDIHGLIHPEALPLIKAGDSLWWQARRPRYLLTHTPRWYAEPPGDGQPGGYQAIGHIVRSPVESLDLWERVEAPGKP